MKCQPTKMLILCLCIFALGGLFLSVASISSADVTLGWDPNSENDIQGYGVYVSRGSPGPPFEHLGDVFIDELSDPGNPSVTLTEIDWDGTYYFAATAFDSQGNESNYSKQLCVQKAGGTTSLCESDSSGGGGGG
jgi:hypothetical protein